jgi:1-acyl-sn-glycerol-3-phosphate acyltransferase
MITRTLRYLVATLIYTVWYGTRIIVAALAGIKSEPGGLYDRLQRDYGAAMMRSSRLTLRVEGLDRIPVGRPVVFVANHISWADIWVLLVGLPGTVRFVFKKELSKVPFLGQAAHAMGHIEMDRANRSSAFAAYDRAAGRVRQGTSAIVFAEGTRSRRGKLQPFKKGPFVLAIAAQAPIVPVYCEGTYEHLPPGSISPVPGEVSVRIGEPIPTAGLGYDARDDLAEQARRAMIALGAVE